jgi:hypothetical protein
MGHENMKDSLPLAGGISGRRSRRRWAYFGLAGAGVALLGLFFCRSWLLNFWSGDRDNSFPPGVLADYVPPDSEALLVVNVRSLRQSPLGRQHLGSSVQQLPRQEGERLRWIELLGINPLDDLDTILISFAPGGGEEPLWLARGRFDRSRMQFGPNKLQATQLDHFRLWKYTERLAKRTTLLAPVGDMLVAGETPARVRTALLQASDPGPSAVRDAALREALAKVDRRQTLWLAASLKSLGPIAALDNYLLNLILRPLLAHADSVYGGITCAEDVQVDLTFGTANDEEADRLETALQSLRDSAPGAALFVGRQTEWVPLLRLLGASTISRQGKTIRLRGRLTADQWEG